MADARVAVFGIGGVGSYAAEALARAGVGRLVLIDADRVSVSNRNRQLPALVSTIGRSKAEVMAERIGDINPDCRVEVREEFYLPGAKNYVADLAADYVIDAVDTIAAKVGLITEAAAAGIPLISSMGMGNKLHPEAIRIGDIYETSVCRLARAVRRELRKAGITSQQVVYSTEPPLSPDYAPGAERVLGSVSFVPSVAGLVMAGVVVRGLANMEEDQHAGNHYIGK